MWHSRRVTETKQQTILVGENAKRQTIVVQEAQKQQTSAVRAGHTQQTEVIRQDLRQQTAAVQALDVAQIDADQAAFLFITRLAVGHDAQLDQHRLHVPGWLGQGSWAERWAGLRVPTPALYQVKNAALAVAAACGAVAWFATRVPKGTS